MAINFRSAEKYKIIKILCKVDFTNCGHWNKFKSSHHTRVYSGTFSISACYYVHKKFDYTGIVTNSICVRLFSTSRIAVWLKTQIGFDLCLFVVGPNFSRACRTDYPVELNVYVETHALEIASWGEILMVLGRKWICVVSRLHASATEVIMRSVELIWCMRLL